MEVRKDPIDPKNIATEVCTKKTRWAKQSSYVSITNNKNNSLITFGKPSRPPPLARIIVSEENVFAIVHALDFGCAASNLFVSGQAAEANNLLIDFMWGTHAG